MNKKPLILLTNDDGYYAPGIKALFEVAKEIGEVVVVAPSTAQSAKGHAITITDPLRLSKINTFGDDIVAYKCSGTPVDCVKLAKNVVLKDRTIDICVSGINHGSNSSINIIYSGTMSAAMEAALEGIDSIGFSLLDYSFSANFEASKPFIRKIILATLKNRLEGGKLLNVNIPNVPYEAIKGIKICRQAKGRWQENFVESEDPRGQKYYWLTGEFFYEDEGEDNDIWALENNYISIVPSKHDLTDYEALPQLHFLEQ